MISRLLARLGGSGSNLVAAGILLSRIAGVVREIVLSIAFNGAGPVTDAFRLAMRIPNVLQNLLGEGALSASFIPVYARLVEDGEEGEADRLAGAVAGFLTAATAVIVAVGVLAARPLVAFFSQFDDAEPELFDLAVTLLRITTVGVGFLVLSAWCLGILNSHRSFFLPYVAPVLWNGVQIAALVAVVLIGLDVDDIAVAAAWAVLAGGVAQFAVQVPRVRRLAPHLRFSLRRSPGVDDVLSRFAPAVGARGVVQISSFVDTFLAGVLLVFGGLSIYLFALPLYLLPISLFGFSVAASELAEMSRRSGNEAMVAERVRPALRRVILPAGFVAAAYLVAGRPIVDAIYGWPARLLDRGFTSAEVTAVSLVLGAFAVGLPASMTARITQNTLYSLGEVRGPARIAVVRLVVSVAVAAVAMVQLDWLFVAGEAGTTIERFGDVPHWPPWERVPEARRIDDGLGIPHLGAVGLAVGSAVASWVEWVLLRTMLRRRLGIPVRSGWARQIAVAAVAAGLVMAVARLLPIPSPVDVVIIVALGAATYLGALWMQGVRRLAQLASTS
ncbi:MAG: murein biosynthesis integral membrane protein MurJ [Actinomycetota bacterium]